MNIFQASIAVKLGLPIFEIGTVFDAGKFAVLLSSYLYLNLNGDSFSDMKTNGYV